MTAVTSLLALGAVLAGCGGGETPRTLRAVRGGSTTSTPYSSSDGDGASTEAPGQSATDPGSPGSDPGTGASTARPGTGVRPSVSGPGTGPGPNPDTDPDPEVTVTTQRVRARLPGAPGPVVVDQPLTDEVAEWYTKLEQGVAQGTEPAACENLLADVQGSGRLDDRGASVAYARLYLGAAEGCLGDEAGARRDLGVARELVPALESDLQNFIGKDTTCQPERLLVWAYDTYLDESITVPCP